MGFLSKLKALWHASVASGIDKSTPPALVEDNKDSAFMIPEHVLNRANITNEMACEIVTVMVGDKPIVSVSGAVQQKDEYANSSDHG